MEHTKIGHGVTLLAGAVAVFGVGFTVWAFQVNRGTQALENMRTSIETIVNLRLSSIEKAMNKSSQQLDNIHSDIRRLEISYETRIRLLEQAQTLELNNAK